MIPVARPEARGLSGSTCLLSCLRPIQDCEKQRGVWASVRESNQVAEVQPDGEPNVARGEGEAFVIRDDHSCYHREVRIKVRGKGETVATKGQPLVLSEAIA